MSLSFILLDNEQHNKMIIKMCQGLDCNTSVTLKWHKIKKTFYKRNIGFHSPIIVHIFAAASLNISVSLGCELLISVFNENRKCTIVCALIILTTQVFN